MRTERQRTRNQAKALVAACGLCMATLASAQQPAAVSSPAKPAAPALIPAPKSLKLAGGRLPITSASRIVFTDAALAPLARILAGDFERIHELKIGAVAGKAGNAGDILLSYAKADPKLKGTDAYRVIVNSTATVKGENYGAVAFGMMTLIQALRKEGEAFSLPQMTVDDSPDVGFRALQVDPRRGYHSPEWVMQVIDVMRFYKVRLLELHTAETMWIGCVMASSAGIPEDARRRNNIWTQKEMDDVIAYAKERGVLLFPHNESNPRDSFMVPVLANDFNPDDKFADYVDEIDGKGKFKWKEGLDVSANDRFWTFMKAVTQRSYDQFAKGWPGGILPYYHIGPVYGEGGASAEEAVKLLKFLKDRNPKIKMMFWNGPSPDDAVLAPQRKNLIVAFYNSTWGGNPQGWLENDCEVVNVSASPLYICTKKRDEAERQGKWIFEEFQLYRFCGDSAVCEKLPVAKVQNCLDPKQRKRIVGAMLPTWDFGSANDGDGHLTVILPCIPFFAEHVWTVRPYPYPKSEWEKISAAYEALKPLVQRIVDNPVPADQAAAGAAAK